MAFSGRQTVSLQTHSLGGRVPGPFLRHIPFLRPALFQLKAWVDSTFSLEAAQSATFPLVVQRNESFQLGA